MCGLLGSRILNSTGCGVGVGLEALQGPISTLSPQMGNDMNHSAGSQVLRVFHVFYCH